MSSTGLSHVTFIVNDLDRMEQLLAAVLGAVRVYDSGGDTFSLSEERFFLIGQGTLRRGSPSCRATRRCRAPTTTSRSRRGAKT